MMETADDQKFRQKAYEDTRADLLKRQLSNSENADRSVLSCSTASLGFSLAFLKDVIHLSEAKFSCLLYLSWLLFCLAIVATLFSFFTSQKAIDAQLSLAERYFIENDASAFSVRTKTAKLTEYLNTLGSILLVTGIVITCIFVGSNLWKGNAMTKRINVTDGAPIPRMQSIHQVRQDKPSGALNPSSPPLTNTSQSPTQSSTPAPAASNISNKEKP